MIKKINFKLIDEVKEYGQTVRVETSYNEKTGFYETRSIFEGGYPDEIQFSKTQNEALIRHSDTIEYWKSE